MKALFIFLTLHRIHVDTVHGNEQEVIVDEFSNAVEMAKQICINSRDTCPNFVRPLIELHKNSLFGSELNDWKYNEGCGCSLPPQRKMPHLQYFHIPKSGTSVNWFLRDYFDGCEASVGDDPCPTWLENESQQSEGLCNGRLFSCMGHSVSSDLPNIVLGSPTNAITFLREPFARLQSDFHYLTARPDSVHRGPELNTSFLLQHMAETPPTDNKMLRFATYPGIANCATKMLNGFQCGDDVALDEEHLQTAIRVIDNFLFYGITEYFSESICLFSFTFGGKPAARHFKKYRTGKYKAQSMRDAFPTLEEQRIFTTSESYDLILYSYALENFMSNFKLIHCGEMNGH